MEFEREIEICANAEDIFNLYRDVPNWKSWDPEIKNSSLDGKLRVGAIGIRNPKKGPSSVMTMTEVAPNKSLSVRNSFTLCSMLLEHTLEPKGKTVKVRHRVSFTGLLSPFYRRIVGPQLGKKMLSSLEALKAFAENMNENTIQDKK